MKIIRNSYTLNESYYVINAIVTSENYFKVDLPKVNSHDLCVTASNIEAEKYQNYKDFDSSDKHIFLGKILSLNPYVHEALHRTEYCSKVYNLYIYLQGKALFL